MQITDNFDSGNIRVINATDASNIQLEIKHDNQSEFYQWFHFKLQTELNANGERQEHVLHLNNVKNSAFPGGWNNYQAVASYDREHWFRVPTQYDGEKVTISFTPEFDSVYLAYFAPYSYERHQDLIHNAQLHPLCQLQVLGQSIDGRDMSLLTIGEPSEGKPNIWITARQHPGETMAEWFVEGLLDRLLDEDDGLARVLLNKAVFYIVPNMNPDGSVRGHLRTNAVGANLNREWLEPTMDRSPEVYLVREKMLEVGVDMFLDAHGDETIPANFVAGCEGIVAYDARHKALEDKFKDIMLVITPEFQDTLGYAKNEPGKANPTVGTNWVGNQFKCLAYTIEMPFKDNDFLPDASVGWSDERSRILGRDFLTGIYHMVDDLR
ncbi:M14 family metallopeptidase [Colwellia echini]|uniref:Carboxypeptidase family protein n=1 Tax=Colwellia echini TaxID=1982103 RepID=A0ABY3N0F1_9GAMM|nr:M14-type cytosolic carboxypeptidase [Colwellia echini]TYK66884.1 carboxypeptidase family protein [Colwellia echini]